MNHPYRDKGPKDRYKKVAKPRETYYKLHRTIFPTTVLWFGKYKNKEAQEVIKLDVNYMQWLCREKSIKVSETLYKMTYHPGNRGPLG